MLAQAPLTYMKKTAATVGAALFAVVLPADRFSIWRFHHLRGFLGRWRCISGRGRRASFWRLATASPFFGIPLPSGGGRRRRRHSTQREGDDEVPVQQLHVMRRFSEAFLKRAHIAVPNPPVHSFASLKLKIQDHAPGGGVAIAGNQAGDLRTQNIVAELPQDIGGVARKPRPKSVLCSQNIPSKSYATLAKPHSSQLVSVLPGLIFSTLVVGSITAE